MVPSTSKILQVAAKATGLRQQNVHGYQKQYPPRGNDVRYQKNYPPRVTGRYQSTFKEK